MKPLIQLASRALKRYYYYRELKQVVLIAAGMYVLYFLYHYGLTILKWIFTQKGLTCLVFFMASLVLSLTIRIYYRMMVIKYYEKDTNIALFKE